MFAPVWCAIPAMCALTALGTATFAKSVIGRAITTCGRIRWTVAESPFAHNAVGMALMNPGSEMTQQDLESFASEPERMDEARRHFERAVELRQSQQDPNSVALGQGPDFE